MSRFMREVEIYYNQMYKAANKYGNKIKSHVGDENFIAGAEWQEKKMFKLHDEWLEYTRKNFDQGFPSISFRSYVEQFKK